MSNERHETVADIVAKIRSVAYIQTAESPSSVLQFADRIEEAAKREREAGAEAAQICGEIGEMVGREAAYHQPVTDCHGLNAAAMREALEKTQSVIATCMEILNKIPDGCDYDGLVDEVADELCDLRDSHVKAALSDPPRNCDKYTIAESLRKYGFPTKSKPWGEKEWLDFCEWYISEAKGETDGSK